MSSNRLSTGIESMVYVLEALVDGVEPMEHLLEALVHRLEAGADQLALKRELVLHAGRAPQEPRTYDVLHPLRQVRAYVGTDLFDLALPSGIMEPHSHYTRASCPIHRPGGAGASPTGPLTGRAGADSSSRAPNLPTL